MIRPALHGMLIGQGVRQVEVYRKPMVGFYYLEGENAAACSGIDVREKTNRYILGTALREFGFSTIYQGCCSEGTCPDDFHDKNGICSV